MKKNSSVEILAHHYIIFDAQGSLINQTETGIDRMSLDLMFVCRHIKKVMGGIKFLSKIYIPLKIECQENKIISIFFVYTESARNASLKQLF